MTEKILLVDDDPNVLQGYKRHLRKVFELEWAVGGEAALQLIAEQGPFAVVVSDMQMPEMSGTQLLSKIREISSQTVRIMLTGNADQRTAVEAVNQGSIFRFLNKPCSPEELAQALEAGLTQYRLVTAEAELLSKTLAGSVRLLTQVLSLAMPAAFGQTQEARSLVRGIAEQVSAGPMWQLEMAAMLMRVGCVALPHDVLERYLTDKPLNAQENALVRESPDIGYGLVSTIPRLEGVALLIKAQNDRSTDQHTLGGRILRIVGDFQRFKSSRSPFAALQYIEEDGSYDAELVNALAEMISGSSVVRDVTVPELREGMILEKSVEDLAGRILIAGGNEVHQAMIHKLVMLRKSGNGVREPIHVRVFKSIDEDVDVVGQPTTLQSSIETCSAT
jgi:response regulator RpfG family c-di-GMP phosphodiesterase